MSLFPVVCCAVAMPSGSANQGLSGDESYSAGGAEASHCFRPEIFLEPGFSVDAFLQDCRRRVAMTELQHDLGPSWDSDLTLPTGLPAAYEAMWCLQSTTPPVVIRVYCTTHALRSRIPCVVILAGQYHSSLSTAMFTLINKDYGDFLSLSANLAGLDKNIAELTNPMGELKQELLGLKSTMDAEITELEGRMRRRIEIREQRTLLQRFLNISASVDKIEKLLAGGQDLASTSAGAVDGGPDADGLSGGAGGLNGA